MRLPPREQYVALKEMRAFSEEGRRLYARCSGIEGHFRRECGRSACVGHGTRANVHLQHVVTVAAINLDRIENGRRTSRRPRRGRPGSRG